MTPPALTDTHGRPFPLDRHLASGGEGAVFTLPNDPARLAKVYLKPCDPQRAEKLAAMVALANPQLTALAAWPSGLLLDARTRKVAGFVMPRLIDCQPIQHLYNPAMRLKFFPRAGWTFQVRAAQNLAAAFDEVHKAGCLVCDVNQSNAQVLPQALVGLIDCDSFQVRANGKEYLCDVGTPHYTPPELQGKHLRGLKRTENHDRFGLGVLVYQLLFVGRHPYAGVYGGAGDPSFEQLIAEFRFAQGPMAHSWGMSPPPHTPTFSDIPPDLGALFRRAFERGSEAGTRPRPTEWLPALRLLEQNSVECAADPGHKYWRGAGGCVWCRLARGGPEYFFGVAGTAGTFAVDEAKLRDVLQRLARSQPAEFRYERDRFAPAERPAPDPLPEGLDEHRATAQVLGGATALCVLAMPLGFVRGFICVIAFFAAIVFGAWLAVLLSRSPWQREFRRRRRAYARTTDDLREIEDEWVRCVRTYHDNHAAASRRVRRLIDDCRGLAGAHQVELQHLTANAETAARLRHLRFHLLAEAEIPKIGAGRKQTLAASNVVTAADVEWDTVRGIKGFGDALTGNLMTWKAEVLRAFRFDPKTAVSPAEQHSLVVRFRARQQQILAELDRVLPELEALAPACRAALQQLVPELKDAIASRSQAEADFRLIRRKG